MESSNSIHKEAFFFIPDISGFTQFIVDRDFQHQQYLIAELLEVLIENNPLQLHVNEIEGDAILFYKLGNPPPLKELVQQSNQMYLAFHSHLKKYGVSRLCNCPTCQSVSRLTLKFIAHHGSGAFHRINNREKIFGTDIIQVHRLLKNNIGEREYLLVTDSLLPESSTQPSTSMTWLNGSESYDSGNVNFQYLPLESWYPLVPEPVLPEPTIYRVQHPEVHTVLIDADIETVYDSLVDLSQRQYFMTGMKGLTIKDQTHNHLNRICTTFQCSMEHDQCTFETSNVEFSPARYSFSETLKELPITFNYVMERKEDQTLVSLIIHPALKIPKKWMFDLMMKRKINRDSRKTLENLKVYCESKKEF